MLKKTPSRFSTSSRFSVTRSSTIQKINKCIRTQTMATLPTTAETTSAMQQLGLAQRLGVSFVNVLFNVKLIRVPLAKMARLVLADNARRFGVDWKAIRGKWKNLQSELDENFASLNNNLEYPEYYTAPFHAYEGGNLNWEAAYEAEAATLALTLRYWPDEVKSGSLLFREAQDRLRNKFVSEVKTYWSKHKPLSAGPEDICEIGCSVGISTEYLANAHYSTAKTLTGLDLSPHFLAVASSRAKDSSSQEPASRLFRESKFVHSAAEVTHETLGEQSTDLIYANFLFHELPADATRSVLKSVRKTLRQGGVVAIADVDVERMVKRSSPALFALFQITEPYFKEYALLNFEAEMLAAGFIDVQVVLTDPKNRLILARSPE